MGRGKVAWWRKQTCIVYKHTGTVNIDICIHSNTHTNPLVLILQTPTCSKREVLVSIREVTH